MAEGIQKSTRSEDLEKLINQEKAELPAYFSTFERVFRLKLPLEGSRKLFMAYILSCLLLIPVSLGLFICVLDLNSILSN